MKNQTTNDGTTILEASATERYIIRSGDHGGFTILGRVQDASDYVREALRDLESARALVGRAVDALVRADREGSVTIDDLDLVDPAVTGLIHEVGRFALELGYRLPGDSPTRQRLLATL